MDTSLIYLDYNSTTPVDKEVLQAMLPYFSESFGNAASKTHPLGWKANAAIEKARAQVADLLQCIPEEIIFTSGSTESCNLAIKGVFEKYSSKGNHIIVSSTEHKAVLDTCLALEKKGASVTCLGVKPDGLIDPDQLARSVRPETILVCMMLANNETGVIQPIREIADIVHGYKTLLFCDATQAAGKIPLELTDLGADLLCISAHKMYGPKGTGALFVKRKNPRVVLEPALYGGGHENGLRSGTLNVPGIVGMGKACELAKKELWDTSTRVSLLRASLEHQLLDIKNLRINGNTKYRVYNTSNLCFSGPRAPSLIGKINHKICVSSGSACTSALAQPSHVLKAMGLSDEDSYSSIRFSLGKYTTQEEIDLAVSIIKTEIDPNHH